MSENTAKSSTYQVSKYLKQLDYLLTEPLCCPIYLKHFNKMNIGSKIPSNSQISNEDEDDLLLIMPNEQDKNLFNKLKQFILPGQVRLSLIEWLLEQYEPGVLSSDDLKVTKQIQNSNKVEQIEAILRQFGIINYSDKIGGTQNSLDKSIEGLNGTLDSIELLVRIASFVMNSQQMENIDPKQLNFMQDKLMNHICVNQAAVFQPTVRLFPPGFPKSEEDEYNLDQLDMIVDDLMYKVEKTQQKIKELNAQTMQQNQDQIQLASQSDLEDLRTHLNELKTCILRFNDEFEDTMKRDLSRLAQNQIQTQLGQVVDETQSNLSQFLQMSNKFQDLVEGLGKLQIRIQMIGLNEENNYKRDDLKITNEKVLELVNQVKNLKISLAFKAKYPSLYCEEPRKYKVEYDPDSGVFIDDEHDKYGQAVMQEFSLVIKSSNVRDRDTFLRQIYQALTKYQEGSSAPNLKNMFDESYRCAEKMGQMTSNVSQCQILFKKGKQMDTGKAQFDFTQANRYFMVPYYGYYQNPGLIQYSFVVRKYSHLLGGLFKAFKSMEMGYKWNYDRYDSKYYFIKEFKPFSQYKIRTQWQYNQSGRVVDQNAFENLNKHSLKFIYNLDSNSKTKIFKHSAIHDNDQYTYLKFSSKNRTNKVNTNHSSRLLMENALGGDTLQSVKLGLRYNVPFDFENLHQNLCLRTSTEINTNHEDISYIKGKLFTRFLWNYNQALFQFNLTGGVMKNIMDGKRTKINDNFYLKNFKGIRNIGYHYDASNPNKGLSGENLGFDRFLNVSFKVSQIDMPLFGQYNIKPFIHTNLALAPNRNIIKNPDQPQNLKTFLLNYGRASLGFGLSLQLPSMAIECYFNPLVYRQKNELKADFQVNLGFD